MDLGIMAYAFPFLLEGVKITLLIAAAASGLAARN